MAAMPRKWGILATGGIAKKFAKALEDADETDHIVAVASRDIEKARAFAADWGPSGIKKAYGSYEDLLADAEVEFVYIATPHPQHGSLIQATAAAGKHILCEKPLCVNSAEAELAIDACRRAGVALVENYMYRFNPQTQRLVEIVRSGAIGTIHRLSTSFAFKCTPDRARLWDPDLAGGGILDVGCYPVSIARLVAGAIDGCPFSEPVDVQGSGTVTEQGVDSSAVCVMRFANGLIADCHCSLQYSGTNDLRLWGSSGDLSVNWPWQPARGGDAAVIRWHDSIGEEHCERPHGLEANPMRLAAAATGEAANSGGSHPAISLEDMLGQMRALDAWRRAVGVSYKVAGETA